MTDHAKPMTAEELERIRSLAGYDGDMHAMLREVDRLRSTYERTGTTHWDGCRSDHLACALRENARLRGAAYGDDAYVQIVEEQRDGARQWAKRWKALAKNLFYDHRTLAEYINDGRHEGELNGELRKALDDIRACLPAWRVATDAILEAIGYPARETCDRGKS